MTDSPINTGLVTPDEAVFVAAERLGCRPDLASVVDALEEVARGE